jgi:copper chaperone CopZ
MTTPITLHVRIAGMTCESCVKLSTMKLKKLPGVQQVSIDLKTGDTSITSETSLSLEQLQQALVDTHYTVLPPVEPEASTT